MVITYHAGRRIQGLEVDRTGIESNQGYAGGDCSANAKAGGGGAGAVGNPQASSNVGGNGGAGLSSTIFDGSTDWYAGGGGGASWSSSTTSSGGIGGGGVGSENTGTAGTTNTGSGGGGGGEAGGSGNNAGGAGGSGIIIISYTTSGAPSVTSSVTPTTNGTKTVHSFLADGTFTPSASLTVEYLVIAGGGGGGGGLGGGGGAGGFITATGHAVTGQAYTITVGAGGAGAPASNGDGSSGDNSVFDTITSTGGGYGSGEGGTNGGSGGSGGGAGGNGSSGGTAVTYFSTPSTIPANAQVGSRFEETDTQKMYHFEGQPLTGNFTSTGSQYSYNSTNDRIDFALTSSSTQYASYDLGSSTVGTDDWILDYTINVTSKSGSGNTVGIKLALGSSKSAILSNTYHIEMATDSSVYQYAYANSSSVGSMGSWSFSTDYYVRISLDYSTQLATFKIYLTEADRTDDTNASASATKTYNVVSNLRYLVIANGRPTNGYTINGYVKGISLKVNGISITAPAGWSEEGT